MTENASAPPSVSATEGKGRKNGLLGSEIGFENNASANSVKFYEPSIGLSDDWYTPPEYFKALGLVFDLDPASPGPDHWVPARKVYTKADDGLRQVWHGLVWLNPPFGGRRGHVPWLHKFFAHNNGIALCAARTSADWFQEVVVPNAELLLFPNGKTKFHRPDGSVGKEPGTGIVLIGAASLACEALRRSGLGACMVITRGEQW